MVANTYSFPRSIKQEDKISIDIDIQNATELSIDLLSSTKDKVYCLKANIEEGNVVLFKNINEEETFEVPTENMFNKSDLLKGILRITIMMRKNDFVTYCEGTIFPHELPISHDLEEFNYQDILRNIKQIQCKGGKIKTLKFEYE